MTKLKLIRQRLGVTQEALAGAMGCVQGSVVFYENGRELPQARARLLISFAAERGLALTFDHLYGEADLPASRPADEPAQQGA